MKHVFLLNTHSTLNSGDTAIVVAQINLLRELHPNVALSITSRTPERDQLFYRSFGISVFPPLLPAPSVFSPLSAKITKTAKSILQWSVQKQVIDAIAASDIVISSGGGYFWSPGNYFPGPMFLQNLLHVYLASVKQKPLFFFPQSFGPFQNSLAPRLLSRCLQHNNVQKIFTREERSFNEIKGLVSNKDRHKIEICPDLAFALEPEPMSLSDRLAQGLPRPRIGVTLRHWDFPEISNAIEKKRKRQEYVSTLKEVCIQIYRRWQGSIVIFPQVRGPGTFENDVPVSTMFVKELSSVIPPAHVHFVPMEDGADPQRLISLVSHLDLIIATRFHSAIFALITGVPAIAIGYQPKSAGIMKLLNLDRYCTDIGHMSASQIIELTEEILNNRAALHDMIRTNVAQLRNDLKSTLISSLHRTDT